MVTYWERLKPEMDARNMEVADLARAINVTFQAVAKVRNGGAFGSANNFKAATLFGLAPRWLATGEGNKWASEAQREAAEAIPSLQATLGTVWPFPTLQPADFEGLGESELTRLEKTIRNRIEELKSDRI
ncbi:hypothetical protein RD110_07980 [Rhodoferax koreense]|uniref:HTH cro/C1-type domain-containing protein n=1 Tax=Rhodoferax koreensis TaxID=1842727 RepID=A0A1P8JTS7_9BURK|nr:helix-turn-helix transcriptional regulator [Rhodoferax koreense]APW37142.1 hypothetical protein RD110_07980 [Rhodoferax koreense]